MTSTHQPLSVEDSLGLTAAQRKKEQIRRRRRRRPVIESAGALVWRVRHETLEVLLVHRPRYDDWSWPKGKLDPGESAPAAAAREVAEETGIPVVLGIPLPRLEYLTRAGYRKRVHYWAAREASETAAVLGAREPVADVDPKEIDDTRWVPALQAATELTFADDTTPLEALIDAHEKGWLTATPLVIVRHATARKRASWPGGETTRPLTPSGYIDAARILPILSAFGIEASVTSPWRRCHDTIAPFAHAVGIDPDPAPELTEEAHNADPAAVEDLIRAILSQNVPTALCTHRPVLRTVLRELRRAARKPFKDALPKKNPYLAPGSLLVTHIVHEEKGPRIIAGDLLVGRQAAYRARTLTSAGPL